MEPDNERPCSVLTLENERSYATRKAHDGAGYGVYLNGVMHE